VRNRDLYIEILIFGKANLGKPICYSELIKYLKDKSYDFDEFSVKQFFTALFIDKKYPNGNSVNPNTGGEYFLEHEGYFNLLEFDELTSARRYAFWATIFAIAAIVISIISSIVSINYSKVQLNTPTKIEESQIKIISNEELIKTVKELESGQKQVLAQVKQINKQLVEYQKEKIQMPPTEKALTD
jgi:hypothetical protein